jgi:alpha-mannosidase
LPASSGGRHASNCQKHEGFVALDDRDGGIAIANRGLPEYAIVPYERSWLDDRAYRDALDFVNPLSAIQTSVLSGERSEIDSWVDIGRDHIVVSALKKAEIRRDRNREGVVIRVYNLSGKTQEVSMTFRSGA